MTGRPDPVPDRTAIAPSSGHEEVRRGSHTFRPPRHPGGALVRDHPLRHGTRRDAGADHLALLPARLFGTLLITAPLLVRRKLGISRRTFPLVLSAGVAEVVGLVSYTFGARHDLAVAAVLASQSAATTTVAAYFLFGERLRRHQVLGVATVIVGIVTLSALRG